MSLVSHQATPLRLGILFHLAIELIRDDAVLVDDGTQDQVISLLFNQLVAVCANLVEACRCSNPKDSFPGTGPCQAIVQLVREFQTSSIVFVLRVVV